MNLKDSFAVSDVSWHELLLNAPVSEAFNNLYKLEAQALARAFLAGPGTPTPAALKHARDWYASDSGQATLCQLVDKVWGLMARIAPQAMPAHDQRHAMYKVPAYAILHMAAENVTGWERIGILGALLHDYGRWAEERLFGGPGEGVVHARFSFLLAGEILAEYELPALIRHEILRCALEHTTGANPEDPMPLKLTVSADRDQLYGPEIVLRLAHHGIGGAHDHTSFYGEKSGTPILTRLKHFHDNRLPGPLFGLQSRTTQMQGFLRTFLLMAEPYEASKTRWVREPSTASAKAMKASFEPAHWESAWTEAHELAQETRVSPTAQAALLNLLSATHIAPNPVHLLVALDKLSELPANREKCLTNALDFITLCRIRADQQEYQLLTQIRALPGSDPFVCRLTDRLLSGGTNDQGLNPPATP